MPFLAKARSVMKNLFLPRRVEAELDEEVRAHLEMLIEEKVRAGITAEQARRQARIELGGIDQVKEQVYEVRPGRRLETFFQDFRFGLRMLLKSPGFTLTVLLTLALSVGANTAIFSLVNALLLKHLPYDHPERIGTIYTRISGPQPSDERHNLNGEQWELLRDQVPALVSGLSGSTTGVNLKAGSSVRYVRNGRVSARYFEVLALQPVIGRTFSEDEDRPHGPKAVVLSYSLWRNIFGGDPGIVGRSILLKGEPHTLVGVLAQGAVTPLDADVFTPLQADRDGEGRGTNFKVVTRLREGATWREADAQINRSWSQRANRYDSDGNHAASVSYYSVPLQKGQTDSLRPPVLALMISAGFILLIACANLAGLTLVRMLRRTAEIATRMALGASSWQIQRQFWIENLLVALVGGGVAVGVGFFALRLLLSLLPEHFLPVAGVPLDGCVLGFTLTLSLVTSLLFGMLPAFAARRVDFRSSMAERTVAAVGSPRLRQALIAGEVALTVLLLAGAGLLIRSLIHLETLPAGFNPEGLLVAKASLDDARYHNPATFRKLLDQSVAAMREIPGVESAAVGSNLPYEFTGNDRVTASDGKEAGYEAGADWVYVTPGYFETLEMPLLAGRVFTQADGPDAQPVAVVNHAFARKFYGGGNPVGRYINRDTLIVGEVADVPLSSGLDPVAPLQTEETLYVPAAQLDQRSSKNHPILSIVHVWIQPNWILRTAGPAAGLTGSMQRALASTDANLPCSGFYSMKDLLARTLATQRIEVALLGALAVLALMLSAVGVFGLVANMVSHRTREIGIRMALGSSVRKAMFEVGVAGVAASALGAVLGLAISAGALRAMRSVIFGVGVYDTSTLSAVVIALALVVAAATILPALKIAKIDPARVLRDE